MIFGYFQLTGNSDFHVFLNITRHLLRLVIVDHCDIYFTMDLMTYGRVLDPVKLVEVPSNLLLTVPGRYFYCDSLLFLLLCPRVYATSNMVT